MAVICLATDGVSASVVEALVHSLALSLLAIVLICPLYFLLLEDLKAHIFDVGKLLVDGGSE